MTKVWVGVFAVLLVIGVIASRTRVDAEKVDATQCVKLPTAETVTDFEKVDCDAADAYRMLLKSYHPASDYPGDAAIELWAEATCPPATTDYFVATSESWSSLKGVLECFAPA